MSKVISGNWDDIPHSEKVVRWERVFKTLDDMSEHAVDHHFDMGTWGRHTDCGTVGCAAGQCALDPWFNRRGFGIHISGVYNNFTGSHPAEFFGKFGYSSIFLSSFEYTPMERQRAPWAVHAAVKRAVHKYVSQLKREA